MNWEEAIEKSSKGSATRIIEGKDNFKTTIIRYKDSTGFSMVSNNDKVDFFLSRPAQSFEMDGYDDWQPSE